MRPAGGRCHCTDRGDTGRRSATQGCPAEDYGGWQLVGAGFGKVSGPAQPQRRSRHPQVSVEHNNNALHSTNLSAIVNYYSINCSVFKNSVLFFSAENLSISFNCMTYLWQYL